MFLVVVMYGVKVLAKLGVGWASGSIIMTADGYHNVSDIFEAGFVIVAIAFASGSGSGAYPFGRRNVESIAVLVIGLLLMLVAFQLFVKSVVGIIQEFSPETMPRLGLKMAMDSHRENVGAWYWATAATALVSIGLSVIVSTLQIEVGTRSAKPIIVGDGKETRSDGLVEFVVLAGLSGEYFFNAPWIEYLLGPLAAYIVARAGHELAQKGWDTLLQHSIGAEHDRYIEDIARKFHGVADVPDTKTFMIGGLAIVMMKVVSRCSADMNRIMKPVVVDEVGRYLAQNGFPSFACYIRIEAPPLEEHRVAYAVVERDGSVFLAPNLRRATAILIADIEHGVPKRMKSYPLSGISNLPAFLATKHVVRLVIYTSPHPAVGTLFDAKGIDCQRSTDLIII